MTARSFRQHLIRIRQRLDLYERLMRLDKPIGILLLLWPTLWALWLAALGKPPLFIVWVFALGVVLMRSAGCVINDIADRRFDPQVERTRARPLAAGEVGVIEALALFAVLTLCAFVLILPLLPLLWRWALAALAIAVGYPFAKRFFALPQAWLGVAFGFGIPMSYAVLFAQTPSEAWWLLLANVFWALAYDTEYALVDIEDDRKIGIHTAAITFGRFVIVAIMLCYAMTLGLLAWVGYNRGFGWGYFGGLTVAALIALYHYRLIRGRDRNACFKAFRHNNWFGLAVFAGLVAELNLLK